MSAGRHATRATKASPQPPAPSPRSRMPRAGRRLAKGWAPKPTATAPARAASKVKSLAGVVRAVRAAQAAGRRIVFTNGCFDLLHRGHVRYLERARALGDVLVVAVNSDASVRALKGRNRPLVGAEQRAEVLAALAAVDFVVIFDELDPARIIHAIRPDVLAKGGDWSVGQIVGADFVRSAGGRVYSLPFVAGESTTGLIGRILSNARDAATR